MTGNAAAATEAQLREEVIRLGPWHVDIEVAQGVSTRAFLDAPPGTYPDEHRQISFYDPRPGSRRRSRPACRPALRFS